MLQNGDYIVATRDCLDDNLGKNYLIKGNKYKVFDCYPQDSVFSIMDSLNRPLLVSYDYLDEDYQYYVFIPLKKLREDKLKSIL